MTASMQMEESGGKCLLGEAYLDSWVTSPAVKYGEKSHKRQRSKSTKLPCFAESKTVVFGSHLAF